MGPLDPVEVNCLTNPVIKAASYCLFHAPDMVLTHGTTLMIERDKNPASPLLTAAKEALRPFEKWWPIRPTRCISATLHRKSWRKSPAVVRQPGGGQGRALWRIFPLDELIAMMKIADAFNLVVLEEGFAQAMVEKLASHPLFTEQDLAVLGKAQPLADIQELLDKKTAVPLEFQGEIVGCVKQAHEWDVNLKADVMFENLAAKASGAWALRHLLWKNGLDPAIVEYIIETSEEACGDMNQRGGGNFAKSIGEVCGCINATGSDTRSFCAGPAHGIVNAAALVKSGIYKHVVVLGAVP